VFPRYLEKSPKELKVQEGIEWLAGLNPLFAETDRCLDKNSEGKVSGSGTVEFTRQ
jgi:hypothetical protein